MSWIPVAAWIAALVLAAVILGFCVYELSWKSRRLRRDLGRLQAAAGELTALQREVQRAQARAVAASRGLRP